MRVTHAGDLARSFGMTQAYSRNKARMDTLTREVSSGLKSDIACSLRGDTRGLANIDNRLRRLDAFAQNTTEADLRLRAGQQALDGIGAIIKGLGAPMLGAGLTDPSLQSVLTGADSNLEAALALMNTESAGQFVLSGARSNAPAVVGADDLMAYVTANVAGLTTGADVATAVNAYFDKPAGGGGYLDQAVTGSLVPAGSLPIGAGESVANPLTAGDPAFRDLLKGLTLAALAKRGVPGNNDAERLKLVESAGQSLLNAESGLTALRAGQGVLQERVELAEQRNASERSALRIARNGIVSADPYESAAALTEAQVQLETLYSITARLSRMSLADRL